MPKEFYEEEPLEEQDPYDYRDGFYFVENKKKRSKKGLFIVLLLLLVLAGVLIFCLYRFVDFSGLKDQIVEGLRGLYHSLRSMFVELFSGSKAP